MADIYDEIYYDLSYQDEYESLIHEIQNGKRIACSDDSCTGILNEHLECGVCGKYIDCGRGNREIDRIAYIFSVARKRNVAVRQLIESIDTCSFPKDDVLDYLEDIDHFVEILAISKKHGRDSSCTIDKLNFKPETKCAIKSLCENYCICKHIDELIDKNLFRSIDLDEDIKVNKISGYKRLSFLLTFISFIVAFICFKNTLSYRHDLIEGVLFPSFATAVLVYIIIRLIYWVIDGFKMFKGRYVKIY